MEGHRDFGAPTETCPIPTTHRRLDDAHRQWHQTADVYGDPDAFRSSLNSIVQTLRSVTLMLQAEKHAVRDFDDWYEPWQRSMASDAVMRWLNDARVRVFHKGDLETLSTARISLRERWDQLEALVNVEVSPNLSSQEIALTLQASVPSDAPDYLVLNVERRWVEEQLPDWELLDALAHCYGVISLIVDEAHQRAEAPHTRVILDTAREAVLNISHLSGRLPCMVGLTSARSVALRVHSGELLDLTTPITFNPSHDSEAIAESASRYRIHEIQHPDSLDPIGFVPYYAELSRRMLIADQHHIPLVILFTPSGMRYLSSAAEDKADKYVTWTRIGEEVERFGATGLVSIAEAWEWFVPAPDQPSWVVPQAPARGEVLAVVAATKDGRYVTASTRFEHRYGRIVARRPEILELAEPPNFLLPVVEAWSRW